MTVKIAGANDIDNLFELNRLFDNETTKEEMAKSIRQNDHEIICIAYVDNVAAGFCTGLIIGSICYQNRRLDIEALYVREEYRNKGTGKALINFLEKEALSRNIKHFHISTNEKNIVAQTVYGKLGYKVTGEILLDKTIDTIGAEKWN